MSETARGQSNPNQRKWWAGISSILVLAILGAGTFAFQNCSQPPDGSGLDPNDSLAQKMDFAYDATIDQITYMSCPLLTGTFDTDTYFTYRVGAYRTGGLKLSDTFFQTYSKKTPDRMIDLLTNSPANTNTVLQLAIRQVGTLNSVVTGSGAPKPGQDYANLLEDLGTNEMNTTLVNTGLDSVNGIITEKRLKYLRNGSMTGSHLEGNLQFGSSEALQSDLRDGYLNPGTALLTLTYVEPTAGGNTNTNVRNPGTVFPLTNAASSSTAYGSGFQLTFTKPAGANGLMQRDASGNLVSPPKELSPYPSNILSQVVERNLLTPGNSANVGQWTCPTNLRLKIVRNGDDLADANCVRKPDPQPGDLSVAEYQQFQIARYSLRVEDWYIDWQDKCIIPKKDGPTCYGDMLYVNYNLTDGNGCDKNSTTSSNALNSKVCVAWASICYRTN